MLGAKKIVVATVVLLLSGAWRLRHPSSRQRGLCLGDAFLLVCQVNEVRVDVLRICLVWKKVIYCIRLTVQLRLTAVAIGMYISIMNIDSQSTANDGLCRRGGLMGCASSMNPN